MSAIQKAINKKELACHCHRRRRGAEMTLQLIDKLMPELSSQFSKRIKSWNYGMKEKLIIA